MTDGVESALTKAMDQEPKIYMDDNVTLLRQMYGTKIKNNRASYLKLFKKRKRKIIEHYKYRISPYKNSFVLFTKCIEDQLIYYIYMYMIKFFV